ncbi:PilW family protein [Neisseria sp. CCUG17229]|uniref:PilW family protein n=1 Tax=Neisseria sp. CCUG17229 TaxID=3392036 RepID=UPI003A0FE287
MRPTFTHLPDIKGFTLIEFLVASALSMIVLMAVSSTYFAGRHLHHAASSRLNIQQDLRSTATLLSRDAQMAGSFGCFNMADYPASSVISDDSAAPFSLGNNIINNKMIPLSEDKIGYSGFSQTGAGLIFQYGIDALGDKANLASSCSSIAKNSSIRDSATAKSALKITGNDKNGTISTLQHVVSAYAVGSFNDQTGLYRFQLDHETGSWGEPQLLVGDIQSISMNYLYIDHSEHCTNPTASAANRETFTRESNLRTSNSADATLNNGTTPALIQIQLNIDHTAVYHIEASVRGGNTCSNHAI